MKRLYKSAPVAPDLSSNQVQAGYTRRQIYSTPQYLFKLSSSFENLYRQKVDQNTGDIVEKMVFKRVREGSIEKARLLHPTVMEKPVRFGRAEPFHGLTFEVYTLVDHYLRGFVLYARPIHGSDLTPSSDRMYFAFERYE